MPKKGCCCECKYADWDADGCTCMIDGFFVCDASEHTCDQYRPSKPMTNGDRIRSMTEEQLSVFLGGIADNCSYNTCDNCPMYGACVDVPLSRDKWLKQEVSEMQEVRLIDANALAESDMAKLINSYLSSRCNLTVGLAAALMPTIAAEPVRHGRWIQTKLKGYYECSACGYEHTSNPDQRFCSYCGARMDGGADNQNESWFTDAYNPCDDCPDWNDEKGCTADVCQMNEGGADNA